MQVADLLDRAEANIDAIRRRGSLLQAFVSELDEATRGKEFRIWNESAWLILLDSRDQLIISLASWCKAQWSKGGLFGQLRAGHLSELKRALPKAVEAAAGEKDARHQAFRRLFPDASRASRATPRPEDLELLKDSFRKRVHGSGLMDDRDDNRAHPFERGKASGSVAMLDLDQVQAVVLHIEELLNDLSLLSRRSTRSIGPLPGFTGAARDLVDLVLGGSIGRMWMVWGIENAERPGADDIRWWWQFRDAYYRRIHDAYDMGAPDAGFPLFNDVSAKDSAS